MAREPFPTWYFALAVVRRGDKFLLVHEAKHGQRWFLPAGGIEPGEEFIAGVKREVYEEAGIPVNLQGIIQLEHTPYKDGTARFRIVFLAEPADNTPPKQQPDAESLEAAWFTLQEMVALPLRSPEVLVYCHYVARGGRVCPMNLLGQEGFIQV